MCYGVSLMSLSRILCQPNSAVRYCTLVDSDAVQFHAEATPLRSSVLCLSSALKMEPECSAEQLSRRHDPEESSLYSCSCHNLKFRTSHLELFMRPILWERFEGCNSEGVCCLEVSVRARAVWE